ncbi:MAG: hypothetical protein Q8P18_07505 [Pseudomonadota bacterium]|nr:hypothetical protein [Pseudomonadota bacterium]
MMSLLARGPLLGGLLACSFVACTGEPVLDSDKGGETAAPTEAALTDASNYRYTLDVVIHELVFTPSETGRIDWTALTRDLQGFPIDPTTDVSVLDLVWFRDLNHEQVQEAVVTGSLVQASVGLLGRGLPSPGDTSIPFTSLDVYGTPFMPNQYFPELGGSWLLRVTTPTNDSAMLAFLVPTEGGPDVYVNNDSAILDFAADLRALTPVALGGITEVSWEGLTLDGRGTRIDPLLLQELSLARYDGLTAEDLEARFFELESLAAATYTLNVYGETSADLADTVDSAGAPFPGFGDSTSTWVLALRCLLCTTPAPSYLTLIDTGA